MKDERLAQLAQMQQGLNSAWPTLSTWLLERKDRFTRELIETNDEETRGRIKELVTILELPQGLQDEAIALQLPPQESELP